MQRLWDEVEHDIKIAVGIRISTCDKISSLTIQEVARQTIYLDPSVNVIDSQSGLISMWLNR